MIGMILTGWVALSLPVGLVIGRVIRARDYET